MPLTYRPTRRLVQLATGLVAYGVSTSLSLNTTRGNPPAKSVW